MSTTIVCFANEYDNYIEKINSQYSLEITKKDGVEDDCDFESFKRHIDSIVESQLNYNKLETEYEFRKNNCLFDKHINNSPAISKSSTGYTTITKTKKASDKVFKIKATYDYYNGTPKYVKNFRNISFKYTILTLNAYFSPNAGYPQVSLIDSGRTGVIKYVGTYSDSLGIYNNYKFSAEFTAP